MLNRRVLLATTVFLITVTEKSVASIISVPSDSSTIQSAINGATNGDTVIIADGIYYEHITYDGKAILVGSAFIIDGDTNHIANTILDGDTAMSPAIAVDTASAVRFVNGENSSSVLSALTVTNGTGTAGNGGGIYVIGGGPILRHLKIISNHAVTGGGVFCSGGSITLANCTISSNTASRGGGFGLMNGAEVSIHECVIALNSDGFGGDFEFSVSIHNSIVDSGQNCVDTETQSGYQIGPDFRVYDSDWNYSNLGFRDHGQVLFENSRIRGSEFLEYMELTFTGDSLLDCHVFAFESAARFVNSIAINTTAASGTDGGIELYSSLYIDGVIKNQTSQTYSWMIVRNSTIVGGGIDLSNPNGGGIVWLDSSIVTADSGVVIKCQPNTFLDLNCAVLFSEDGSPWLDCNPIGTFDTSAIIFGDPRFCDEAGADYSLAANSPAAAPNNSCNVLIGARPVACGPLAKTWWVDTSGSDFSGIGTSDNPFRTIQYAINHSLDGDTVVVREGTYYERISFVGKAILIGSEFVIDADTSHIGNTIINGDTTLSPAIAGDTASVVRFVNGEGPQSTLSGITITGGVGTQSAIGTVGGGILGVNASPTIRFCTISGNSADRGGGWHSDGGGLFLEDCRIVQDTAHITGGGFGVHAATPSLKRCTLEGNVSSDTLHGGWLRMPISLSMDSCTILDGQNIAKDQYGTGPIGTIQFDSCFMQACSVEQYLLQSITINNSRLIDVSVSGWGSLYLNRDTAYDSYFQAWDEEYLYVMDCALFNSEVSLWDAYLTMNNSFIDGPVNSRFMSYSTMIVNNSVITQGIAAEYSHTYLTAQGSTILGPLKNLRQITLDSCVLYSDSSPNLVLNVFGETSVTLRCGNIFRVGAGEWLVNPYIQLDTSDIVIADPRFCDKENDNYLLAANSPSAPINNPCNVQIGARTVGCESVYRAWFVDTAGSDSLGDGTTGKPFRSIQHAINVSLEGDTVIVQEGTYYERISFKGKAIVVGGESILDEDTIHISRTIISGDPLYTGTPDTGSVVIFVNGEDSTSVLSGLTIRDGIGTYDPTWFERKAGGGILCVGGSPRIEHCRIRRNQALRYAGGIYVDSASPSIIGCVIDSNWAYHGGGIAVSRAGASFTIVNSLICDNSAFRTAGGMDIASAMSGTPLIVDCLFEGNFAAEGWGGGVIVSGSDAIFNRCTFAKNRTTDLDVGGAGVFCNLGNISFNECDFIENLCEFGNGGGISLDSCTANITGCSFVGNLSKPTNGGSNRGYGGAVYAYRSLLDISGCSFTGNAATHHGGAISLVDDQGSAIDGTLFIGNSSDSTGGAIFCLDSDPSLGACTFALDTALLGGTAISLQNSSLTLERSIIAFEQGSDPVTCQDGTIQLNCSNVFGNDGADTAGCLSGKFDGSGNLSSDPRFCDSPNGNFTLQSNSKCLPQFNSCGVLVGALPKGCSCCTGIAGDINRLVPEKIDIGDLTYLIAYSFKGGPAPPCLDEADVNGSGVVDISDLTFLVAYMFKSGLPPVMCP